MRKVLILFVLVSLIVGCGKITKNNLNNDFKEYTTSDKSFILLVNDNPAYNSILLASSSGVVNKTLFRQTDNYPASICYIDNNNLVFSCNISNNLIDTYNLFKLDINGNILASTNIEYDPYVLKKSPDQTRILLGQGNYNVANNTYTSYGNPTARKGFFGIAWYDNNCIYGNYQTTNRNDSQLIKYSANNIGDNTTLINETTHPAFSIANRFQSFSPNKSQLAYVKSTGSNNSHIAINNPDCSSENIVYSTALGEIWGVIWLDNKLICFSQSDGLQTDLMLLNTECGNLVNLTNSSGTDESRLYFSVLEQRIYFIKTSTTSEKGELWSMRIDGSSQNKHTATNDELINYVVIE